MNFMQISFVYSKPFVNSENQPYNQKFTRIFQTEVVSLDRAINIR